MNSTSYLKSLICSSCGKSFDFRKIQTYCYECMAPLLADYDIEAVKFVVDRDELRNRPKGMWRWFELLPILNPMNVITLGEGDTPILRLSRIGEEFNLPNLFIKDEALNPTGSFKARGLSAAVSKAYELGVKKLVIPSAGNAGGALAAYAARAGMKSLIYMPKTSPIANIIETRISGAKVELIDGLINEAGKCAQDAAKKHEWFNVSTFKEPYRVEGKKIIGYEIAEALSWHLPDVIIYPTGGGTGLVGMWKAFVELEKLGWLESTKKPRMISVQAEGCAPIVKAFQSNQDKCEAWEDAHTIATGLCVPLSFADKLILKNIRESNGLAISVSDKDIITFQNQLAREEGIFACPEGAATLAALNKLITLGYVQNEETIILFNTASGIKYINA